MQNHVFLLTFIVELLPHLNWIFFSKKEGNSNLVAYTVNYFADDLDDPNNT